MTLDFPSLLQSDSETEQELVSLFGHPKPKVSFKDSMQFKYLVVVDGNSWPSRLQEYLQTNSVVLYTGIFIDWYSWMLVPWIHYVPVRLDFSDMDERIEWLVKNDAKARKIAENARELMKFVSRLEQMQCYTSLLLLEYQHLSK
ncbi:lipopolysaccharide-modifying protein [Obelidium mucronatum]|nr:lipopolysaccharide-modifying protein [Obelidium mucronatum]